MGMSKSQKDFYKKLMKLVSMSNSGFRALNQIMNDPNMDESKFIKNLEIIIGNPKDLGLCMQSIPKDVHINLCTLEPLNNELKDLKAETLRLRQQLKKIETQNKNQAEIITYQSKSLNKQAIKVTHAQAQNEKLSNDFHHHKHIVCRSVDCNEMSGEVEHGTNEFNQML